MHDPRSIIAARAAAAEYPDRPPYDPAERYPEYPFSTFSRDPNHVYDVVRRAFLLAGLDAVNAGTARWNPLRDFIRPGMTVLLKPNFVRHEHPRDPAGWRYTITHGSVIRAVADYVWLALGGEGTIILADAPQTDASFARIAELTALSELARLYESKGVQFRIVDLRREEWTNQDGVIVARRKVDGDPLGSVAFDLGEKSEFVAHRGAGRYYGADYDDREVNFHHTGGRHEYLIAGSAILCDVLFSLPKLKTHKKAGVTVSMKNLVGVNADKNWLPHHTEGVPVNGGDERPAASPGQRLERAGAAWLRRFVLHNPTIGAKLMQVARSGGRHVFGDTEEVVRSGNWWGNDTAWRMVLDLNKLVLYGNPDGTFRDPDPANRKTHLVLVDGIIGGEGRGPLNPDPRKSGIVLFGADPARVDTVAAYLMGFDPDKVPVLRHAFASAGYPVGIGSWRDTNVISDDARWNGPLTGIDPEATMRFVPHFGWTGRIELAGRKDPA